VSCFQAFFGRSLLSDRLSRLTAHIYGWTWEDPAVDVEKLKIQDGDSILCITSAGDNVLHYATKAQVEVQCVDMNP
jgi:betaine lipid synthase